MATIVLRMLIKHVINIMKGKVSWLCYRNLIITHTFSGVMSH